LAGLVFQSQGSEHREGQGLSTRVSIGLVHDYLLVMRGGERTFAAIADCWPDASIYTLLYDDEGTDRRFHDRRVNTSYLQRLGIRQKGFRRLLPLFPHAAGHLPVQDHDLVVSSSSAFAHGVRPRPGAAHICYCHSPFRYAWHERDRALEEAPAFARPLLRGVLSRVRSWDLDASQRVTHYVANIRKARELLDWQPATPLDQGIPKGVAWFRAWRDEHPFDERRPLVQDRAEEIPHGFKEPAGAA